MLSSVLLQNSQSSGSGARSHKNLFIDQSIARAEAGVAFSERLEHFVSDFLQKTEVKLRPRLGERA
jgi:hypothetical protein